MLSPAKPKKQRNRFRLPGFMREGNRRVPQGPLAAVIYILAVFLTVFEVWVTAFKTVDPYYQAMVFLAVVLAVNFLVTSHSPRVKGDRIPPLDIFLAFLALAVGIYLHNNMQALLMRAVGITPLTPDQLVVGIIIVILAFEGVRRALGPGLALVVLFLIGYSFLGHLIPGTFSHRLINLPHFVEQVVYTNDGVFGITTQVAASIAFMFILFGSIFADSGGGDFLYNVSMSLAGRSVGGPAKAAVVASGLYGTVSGSPTSDVLTTGSFTIPLMQRFGFSNTFAGAVEAVASTGGSLMPPVMGSAAFLMAEMSGIAYAKIMVAAIIPALLYYFACYIQVHYRAINLNLAGVPAAEIPKLTSALKNGWHFIIPVVVLVWALLDGYTPGRVALVAAGVTVGASWLNPATRLGLRKGLDILFNAVIKLAPLTMASAAAGLLIGSLMLSGLAGKMISLIMAVGSSNLFYALLITAGICMVMGMGMPTPAAFVLTAVFAAPALVKLGLPAMAAYLFILYFAILSAITPPVAVAAFAASGISGGNPFETGWAAAKLGIVAFIIPFVYVYDQGLLLGSGVSVGAMAWSIFRSFMAVYLLAVAFEGRFLTGRVNLVTRLLMLAGGIMLIVPHATLDLIGLLIVAIGIVMALKCSRSETVGIEKTPV